MEQNTLTKKTEIQEIDSLTLTGQFVVFTLDEYYFAVPVSIVERIVMMVIITTVPGTPESILGVINVHGKIIPVFNIRKIFGFPERELKLTDQLIIARTSEHTIAFASDRVTGVTNRLDKKTVTADKIFPGLEKIIEGLVFFEDGMILIYNLEKLITLENGEMLDLVMKKAETKAKAKAEVGEKIKVKEKAEVKDVVQEEMKKVKKPKEVRAKRVKVSGKKAGRKKEA
jgi:purine-binding chemotaxis protein CheW